MSQTNLIDLDQRFDHHPPSPAKVELHEQVRAAHKAVAMAVVALTPASREQFLALTALEESLMWANAAIARNVSDGES